jgi:hypothetical protein
MSDLPSVTHEGELNMGGMRLRSYRLTNGQTVFNAEDFEAFCAALFGGKLDLTEGELADLADVMINGPASCDERRNGQDPEEGLGAKPASAVGAEGDETPKPSQSEPI